MLAAGLKKRIYYHHARQTKKPDKYAKAKVQITKIFIEENRRRRGYRTITDELKKTIPLNHKTVYRLMKEMGLRCMVRMKKYHSYNGEVGRVAPNLLNRDFSALKPDLKWVTDVTEFHLYGKKLFLSVILDLYNREIVSYTTSFSPSFSMVMGTLDQALSKRPDHNGLILHSDQGWQYQHKRYQYRLLSSNIKQSMSRKGNCLDNAVVENFFVCNTIKLPQKIVRIP